MGRDIYLDFSKTPASQRCLGRHDRQTIALLTNPHNLSKLNSSLLHSARSFGMITDRRSQTGMSIKHKISNSPSQQRREKNIANVHQTCQ